MKNYVKCDTKTIICDRYVTRVLYVYGLALITLYVNMIYVPAKVVGVFFCDECD